MQDDPTLTPEEQAEKAVDEFENKRLERLQADEIKKLRQQIKHLEKATDFTYAISSAITNHIPAAPSIILPRRTKLTGVKRTLQGHASDWHFIEHVDPRRFLTFKPSEFDIGSQFNAYDTDIARARIRYYHHALVDQVLSQKDPKSVETLLLAYEGDLHNGDIHAASVTNCMGSIEGAFLLADIITEDILTIREALPWIHIDVLFVVGNHGRILNPNQKKSPNAKTIPENYDWIVGGIVKRRLAGQENLTVENSEAEASIRKIYGQTHIFHHGHTVRGGGGISELPMFGLAIHVYRKVTQMLNITNTQLHNFHIGHWHKYTEMQYGLGVMMINGSLIGLTERGASLGYSGRIQQRVVWCTTEHPLAARYPLDIPHCIPDSYFEEKAA